MRVVAMLGHADQAVLRVASSLGEVTALAISPDSARLDAAAVATQRVRLWDEALADLPPVGSDREAVLATAFAAAARRLESQIFVIAETAVGYLGSAVAEQLNLCHLSQVIEVVLLGGESANPQLRVMRRCLHGIQRLQGPAAAVLCVLPTADDAVSQAAAAPAETPLVVETTWSLADVGLAAAELPRPLCRLVDAATPTRFAPRLFDSVEALVARLRQDGLG